MEKLNTYDPSFHSGVVTHTSIRQPELTFGDRKPEQTSTLKEYADTFSYVYSLYGLDKRALKLGFLESVMMLNATMRQVTGPITNTEIRKIFKGDPGEVKDAEAFMKDAKRLVAYVAGITVGVMATTLFGGSARKAFDKETLSIRIHVNDRVANSVFMRDFEFMQDKKPAEILNIIDRGKQGTMDLINVTYTEIIPHLTAVIAASIAGFSVDKTGGILGLLRLPILYWNNKRTASSILANRHTELLRKDTVDTSVMNSLQSIEVVKTSDTMEDAIAELGNVMQERDEMIIASSKKHISRRQQELVFSTFFEDIAPLVLGYLDYLKSTQSDIKVGEAAFMAHNQYRTISFQQRSIGGHASSLMRVFSEIIQPALQDIARMEELLGSYDQLDKPDGILEQGRMPVSELMDFDIRVRNLRFKNILHDVSMDIPQGSFITLRGASGLGKTTFLRHLVGLYRAGADTVQYGGKDINSIKKYGPESLYTKLAYVNQQSLYFENMTLRENLLLWTKKEVSDGRLKQVLSDLRLEYLQDRLDSTAKHFSGGELRRIGVARALLKDPKVLFLDEPTANLDDQSARQVLQIIKDMRKNRPDMTVVAVTHDPNFEAIAERIVDFDTINVAGERPVRMTEADSA